MIINKELKRYEKVECYIPPCTNNYSLRLHLNENLYGPSEKCIEYLQNISKNDLCCYDLEDGDQLIDSINENLGIEKDRIIVNSGSSEVIKMVFEVLLMNGDKVIVPNYSWRYYQSLCNVNAECIEKYNLIEGKTEFQYDLKEIQKKINKNKVKLVVITSPNMPTGNVISSSDLEAIINKNKNIFFLVDQAYYGYQENNDIDVNYFTEKYNNVVFVRTFSKFYALANQRIGYVVCNPKLKHFLALKAPLFKIAGLSRGLAIAALNDHEYYEMIKKVNNKIRDEFCKKLNSLKGVVAYKSYSNFVFIKFGYINVELLKKILMDSGYNVRLFFEVDGIYMRITIYTREVMNKIVDIICECCR